MSLSTAAVALYFQYFQRGRLDVVVGDVFYMSYGEAREEGGYADISAIFSVALFNTGARDLFVTRITSCLRDDRASTETLGQWRQFLEPEDAGTPGKTFAPNWKFDGWVRPLTVKSHDVFTAWLECAFAAIDRPLPSGTHELTLEVSGMRPAQRPLRRAREAQTVNFASWPGRFTLDASATDFLETRTVWVGGVYPDSCPIELQGHTSGAPHSPHAPLAS